MSSPEKARDLKALCSATLPTDAFVLGVVLLVADGVKTGGSTTGGSNGLLGANVVALSGGSVRV